MITRTVLHTFRMRKAGAFSFTLLAGMLLAPASHANVTEVSTLTGLGTGLSTQDFTGNNGDLVSSPFIQNYSPFGTLTFSNNSNLSFERQDQILLPGDPGFDGDFTPGTKLLRNSGDANQLGGIADGLTLTFSQPVSKFGFAFDPSAGIVDFTFNVYESDPNTPVATFTHEATQMNSGPKIPSAPFFGAIESGGFMITKMSLFGTLPNPNSNIGTIFPDDFAIGPVSITAQPLSPPPVPEPGVLALLAASLLPIGLLTTRRRRR